MIQRVVGTAGIIKRRKIRKFLKEQQLVFPMLDISINEERKLFSSLFDIQVSGKKDIVEYWCKTVQIHLDRI